MEKKEKKIKATKRATAATTWTRLMYLGLSGLSVLLLSSIFPPVGLSVLAFVALVPWLIVVLRTTPKGQLIISYFAGLAFYLINVHWIAPITIPGYISMSIYLALYWPFAGFLIQRLTRRWFVPLVLAAPAVWVGLEFVRGLTVVGFPWFYLGHSQALNLRTIQIADLAGVFAISFVVMMVNGALAGLFMNLKEVGKVGSALPAVGLAGAALLGTLFYGHWRLGQETTRSGPVVAVIQEDFPMFVDDAGGEVDDILKAFMKISVQSSRKNPDMIVWPETSIGVPVNPEYLEATVEGRYAVSEQRYARQVAEYLSAHAQISGSYLIVGALSREFNTPGVYPEVHKYNSALIFDREGGYVDRYDKIRLVLFGEVVPFRYTWSRLYWFLNEHMTPWGRGGYEYSLTPGIEAKRFTMAGPDGDYRYAIAICYEDTMSDLIRQFVGPVNGEKQIDFLVNISNDGWFNHSAELPQHFHVCVFRAVENRVSVARSVNTGISGIINPDGSIEAMVTDGKRIYGPGIRGFNAESLKIDSRIAPYSRIGDWPVGVMTLAVLLFGLVVPLFDKRWKVIDNQRQLK